MDFLQPIAAIGFVLLLLGAVLMVLKKRGAATFHMPRLGGGAPRRLESLERLPLGPHHSLHLVKLDGRTILVGTSPGSMQFFSDTQGGLS